MLGLGVLKAGAQALKTGATVFAQNQEAKAERRHALMAGAQLRLQREAENRPETTTWWDSLVDGINRLIFPAVAFTILVIVWRALLGYDVSNLEEIPFEAWSAFGGLMTLYTGYQGYDRHKRHIERKEGIAPVKVPRVSRAERKSIKIRAKHEALGPKQQPEVPREPEVPVPQAAESKYSWTPRRASEALRKKIQAKA